MSNTKYCVFFFFFGVVWVSAIYVASMIPHS
jgi:hypothetical protein